MVKRMRSFFAVVMLVIAAAVNAQVTTSSMSGKVVDQSNEAIIGATIQAIHEPSGTHYGAITNVDGRYSIQGMRAGGPYKVEVSYVGYSISGLQEHQPPVGRELRIGCELEGIYRIIG